MEILYYERANKNKTIGYADIKVKIEKPAVLIFRKIAHVQSGDKKWFNLPSFQREVNGQPKYFRYAEFETHAYNGQLMESMNEQVKRFCIENGIEEVPASNFDASLFEKANPAQDLPF